MLLVVSLLMVPAPQASNDAKLAARLQQLEDKAEIEQLLLDYGRHLDNRDFAAYGRLFAKDGQWVGGFGTASGGPAGIQAFMEKAMGTGPNTAHNYHLLTNFVITVNGDTATAWSRWAFVIPGPLARRSHRPGATTTRSCARTATGDSSVVWRRTIPHRRRRRERRSKDPAERQRVRQTLRGQRESYLTPLAPGRSAPTAGRRAFQT